MDEQNNCKFQTQIEYDLPSHKELSKIVTLHSGRNTVSLIFSMAVILFYAYFIGIRTQQASFASICILLFLAIFWISYLFKALQNKNGGIVYRRMLSVNNGVPPRNELAFCEDGIYARNPSTGSCTVTPYSQLRSIGESQHFLIFFQEHKMYSAIRKDSITGGTKEELLSFLFEKGTGIKKKKIGSALPGKIVWVSFIVFSVLSALFALWLSSPVQSFLHRQQPINNYMSYESIAAELEELGITGIDENLIAELEAYDQEYNYVYSYDFGNKALDMLCWAGMGEYDPNTWTWTPSNAGVYWFDMEVMNLNTMYTDFLTGVRALNPQELNFSNMKEDLSWVDVEAGSGIQKVSFDWNGASYILEATVMYDWFDMNVAADLAELVKAENTGSYLYFAYDGGQGILVFYGTPQWCNDFERVTGIDLYDDPLVFY